jgi:hypothetical protein
VGSLVAARDRLSERRPGDFVAEQPAEQQGQRDRPDQCDTSLGSLSSVSAWRENRGTLRVGEGLFDRVRGKRAGNAVGGRWEVNVITVVSNNHSGNQSKRGFDRAYGGEATDKAREMWTYRDVRFAGIAEQMGALGISVDKPADLAPAFDRALAARRPVVIDVRTDTGVVAPLPVT